MAWGRQQVRAGVSGLPGMGLEICNMFQLNDLCRPYRAFFVLGRFTQGVALGCHIGAPLVLAKWGQSSLLTVGGHGRAGSPRCRGVGAKRGQSSLLTVGRHGVGAAAGSGGGHRWRRGSVQFWSFRRPDPGGNMHCQSPTLEDSESGRRTDQHAGDHGTCTARAGPLRIPPTPGGSP